MKGDIVEALQFVKCLIWTELISSSPQPCLALEHELEVVGDNGDSKGVEENEPQAWDELFINDDNDKY